MKIKFDADINLLLNKQLKKVHLEERRFRRKLVKMIKDTDSKLDHYLISCIGVMN